MPRRKSSGVLGTSFRGKLTLLKNRKLALTSDFYNFLAESMKKYRGKTVIVAVHPASEPRETIGEFMEGLWKKPKGGGS